MRFYADYRDWEDYKNGMWRKINSDEEPELLQKAIEFTGNHELYGASMLRVIKEWPVSSKHNLTNVGMNRRAWIGHAAVCLAINVPEHIVRQAWWHLSDEQRIAANHVADLAIAEWELLNNFNKNNYVKEDFTL